MKAHAQGISLPSIGATSRTTRRPSKYLPGRRARPIARIHGGHPQHRGMAVRGGSGAPRPPGPRLKTCRARAILAQRRSEPACLATMNELVAPRVPLGTGSDPGDAGGRCGSAAEAWNSLPAPVPTSMAVSSISAVPFAYTRRRGAGRLRRQSGLELSDPDSPPGSRRCAPWAMRLSSDIRSHAAFRPGHARLSPEKGGLPMGCVTSSRAWAKWVQALVSHPAVAKVSSPVRADRAQDFEAAGSQPQARNMELGGKSPLSSSSTMRLWKNAP